MKTEVVRPSWSSILFKIISFLNMISTMSPPPLFPMSCCCAQLSWEFQHLLLYLQTTEANLLKRIYLVFPNYTVYKQSKHKIQNINDKKHRPTASAQIQDWIQNTNQSTQMQHKHNHIRLAWIMPSYIIIWITVLKF